MTIGKQIGPEIGPEIGPGFKTRKIAQKYENPTSGPICCRIVIFGHFFGTYLFFPFWAEGPKPIF